MVYSYNYFVRVMERLNEEFEDEEEKGISKVIEKLLSLAQPDILEKFAKIIQKEMVCFLHYFIQYFNVLMHYLFTLRELFVQMPMPAMSWKR